ncbi:MAG: DUF262 domain-containing protein [Flavobacterium sp.]
MSTTAEVGKKYSFFELISQDNYAIEIPIIQRDYAQGRESASEIRIHFLKTLRKHLKKDKPIDLDFVYGSIENMSGLQNKFIPLDGQQRLTTLFLLHWYLALKDGRIDEFITLIKRQQHSNFTYETRVSSRDFCNALVLNTIELPDSRDRNVSLIIRNSSWYYLVWDNDPTVSSMLQMLDSIHRYFFKSEALYTKLADVENRIITFQFIELKNFGLTDTLYIKMNARGKALSDFENFKAKFEQILEQHDEQENKKLKDLFAIKMDTVWTDLFWPYKDADHNFDKKVMNLFRVLFMGQYALSKECKIKTLQELFDKRVKWNFYKYEQLKCFDRKSLEAVITQMELLADGNHDFALYLPNTDLIDEKALFEKVISVTDSLNITEALQFFALYNYIVVNNTSEGIEEWMRVIRNLTENTRFDEFYEYEASIKSINELLEHSTGILQYLKDPQNLVKSFFMPQVSEERIKSALTLHDPKWKQAIEDIENHKYLKGQIGFLLKFSGITDSVNIQSLNDWDADSAYYDSFVAYSSKFRKIFKENGLRKFDNFLFERALLSKGDFTLSKGKNWSFLINFDREH